MRVARYNKHENTNYSIFASFAGDKAQWIATGSEDNKVKYVQRTIMPEIGQLLLC